MQSNDETEEFQQLDMAQLKKAATNVYVGKIMLNRAVSGQDFEGLQRALKYLSSSTVGLTKTVSLTSQQQQQQQQQQQPTPIEKNNIEINLSFNPRLLASTVGPLSIHTKMARCLLLPQRYHNENENEKGLVVTTNACQTQLETPCHPRAPGMTPLAKACQCGNYSLARLLLEHGADPNVCANDGLTPLIRMAKIGNLELVRLLLETDESILQKTPQEASSSCPFRANSNYWPSTKHKELLEQRRPTAFRWGTDVYRYDQQAMSALIHACTENRLVVAYYLIEKVSGKNPMAAVDYVNDYKVDPAIWYASAHGNATIVRMLMDDYGAKAEYRKDPTVYSSTPLMEACEWGHNDVLRVLLGRDGSDPRNSTGRKARALAQRAGYHKAVEQMEHWKLRLNELDRWAKVEETEDCPIHLLPQVLFRCVRRYDLIYRILNRHMIHILLQTES